MNYLPSDIKWSGSQGWAQSDKKSFRIRGYQEIMQTQLEQNCSGSSFLFYCQTSKVDFSEIKEPRALLFGRVPGLKRLIRFYRQINQLCKNHLCIEHKISNAEMVSHF